MTANELWAALSAKIKAIIDANSYSIWIERIKPVELSKEKLILSVDDEFAQAWLQDNYLKLFSQVLSAAFPNENREIVIKVTTAGTPLMPPEPPAPVKIKPAQTQKQQVQTSKCIGVLNENFTFDEFVVGPSNSWAHAAALAVAQKPGRAYNPLFIYGDTGIGKTHLMQAVGNKILEKQGKTVAYISTETLLNEYITSIQSGSTLNFRNKYRSVDVLLIDDIQFLASKSGLQEEFFHTFNALYNDKKQIIITSDRPASEISGLEERLVSRFNAGMATQMECPNFETRLAILRYKQASKEKPLSDEVQTFIAENVKSNVRSLEGAMNRVMGYIEFSGGEQLTVENLRYILKDLLDKEKEGDITLDTIQKVVSEFYNIKKTDLLSTDRMRSIALPRQIAMYLSRKLTHASYPEIGKAFDKTHGTVVHACGQIQSSLSVDVELRRNLKLIVEKLGQDPDSIEI